MSSRIGFLVVNRKSGYLLEGKDHAAKIFDAISSARSACRPMSSEAPVPLKYEELVRSLIKGAAFCFASEEGYAKFLSRLRNDPAHKTFQQFSQDRNFVRWRFQKPVAADPANVVNDAAAQVPTQPPPGPTSFNPDILVR